MQLHGIISRAILGNLKTEYLTVIGNTNFPFFASIAIPLSITTGVTILVAQNIGVNNWEKVKTYIKSSLVYNFIFSIFIFLVWKYFKESIFIFIGIRDQQILKLCLNYMQIFSLSIPFLVIEMTIIAAFQGVGNTRPVLYSGLIKVVLNISLDYLLILGKFGAPNLSYMGSAVAFTISSIICSIVLLIMLVTNKKISLKIFSEGFSYLNLNYYKDILFIGIPCGFEMFAWYLATLVRMKFMNKILGAEYIAIFMIIYGIELFVFQFYDALARSTLTLVGQNILKNKKNEVNKILRDINIINHINNSLIIVICIFFASEIIGMFSNDAEIINKSFPFLIFNSFISIPRSITMIYGSAIKAEGDTKWMLFTQLIGSSMIIVLTYVLLFKFEIGFVGIFIAALFDELTRSFINTLRFYYGREFFKIKKFEMVS